MTMFDIAIKLRLHVSNDDAVQQEKRLQSLADTMAARRNSLNGPTYGHDSRSVQHLSNLTPQSTTSHANRSHKTNHLVVLVPAESVRFKISLANVMSIFTGRQNCTMIQGLHRFTPLRNVY
jgi:hypothetical protein